MSLHSQLPCKAVRSGTITLPMGKLRLRDKNDWAKVPEEVSGVRWWSCGLLPAGNPFWVASCLQIMHFSKYRLNVLGPALSKH